MITPLPLYEVHFLNFKSVVVEATSGPSREFQISNSGTNRHLSLNLDAEETAETNLIESHWLRALRLLSQVLSMLTS